MVSSRARTSGVGRILVWGPYGGAEGARRRRRRGGWGIFDYLILKWRILMHISGILTYLLPARRRPQGLVVTYIVRVLYKYSY